MYCKVKASIQRELGEEIKLEDNSIKILDNFAINGRIESVKKFGNGHINKTYLVATSMEKYVLQEINTYVFPKYREIMQNIENVTSFLRKNGQVCQKLVKTHSGQNYINISDKPYRVMTYVEGFCLETPRNEKDLYNVGLACGDFQKSLAEIDITTIYEVIKDFHNTKVRIQQLENAYNNCKDKSKIDKATELYQKFISKKSGMTVIIESLLDGTIPTRITHNDTKLNNIVFDNKSDLPLCLIDLDTIMPGSLLYDFGEAMRIGGSSVAEDSTDIAKIEFNLAYFESFCKGFAEKISDIITEKEKQLLATSVIILTYENGTRFLADYFNNDVYFGKKYPLHNFDRAVNQLELVYDIERKMPEMEKIVKKYFY